MLSMKPSARKLFIVVLTSYANLWISLAIVSSRQLRHHFLSSSSLAPTQSCRAENARPFFGSILANLKSKFPKLNPQQQIPFNEPLIIPDGDMLLDDFGEDDEYCLVFDDMGCEALEGKSKKEQNKNLQKEKCIRVQAGPCEEIECLKDPQAILDKVQQVRQIQSRYGNADLYARSWRVHEDANDHYTPINASETFSIYQFNILAEGLSSGPEVSAPFVSRCNNTDVRHDPFKQPGKAGKGRYGGFTKVRHPDVCLNFQLRKWRILEALLTPYKDCRSDDIIDESRCITPDDLGPDIIALEEVDNYVGFFEPALSRFGYHSIFKAKPTAPGIQLGFYSDGCALFWKKKSFDLIDNIHGSYSIGSQVYIVSLLQHKATGQKIVVAVTHLKASRSEENEKIRTKEALELQKAVSKMCEKHTKQASFGESVSIPYPILLVGDFNTEMEGQGLTCVSSILRANYKSAYPKETPYTTWKTRGKETVKRVIDYIFHQSGPSKQLTCLQILDVPTEEEISPDLLPSIRYPSDHLMIGAKFSIDSSKS